MIDAARRTAWAALTPAGRQWTALKRSLTFDPDADTELPAPTGRDFIICGSPRSGTMLLAAMLWQPPRVVTVAEPWDGLRMSPHELFASLRTEMATTGGLGRGRLDVAALERDGVVAWKADPTVVHAVDIDDDTLVGVKWPAFWRYVERLPTTKFLVCVRHPYDVVRSYLSTGGSLAIGQDYDVPFNRQMNRSLRRRYATSDVRRVKLYDHIYAHLLPHLDADNVFVVRYERWFVEPDLLLDELEEFLGADVGSPRAEIDAERRRGRPDPAARSTVRDHCLTARPLSYPLD